MSPAPHDPKETQRLLLLHEQWKTYNAWEGGDGLIPQEPEADHPTLDELATALASCEAERARLEQELAREIEARNGWWDQCKAAEADLTAARAQCAGLEQENALLIAGHTPAEVPVVTTAGAIPEPDELTALHAEVARYRGALEACEKKRNQID